MDEKSRGTKPSKMWLNMSLSAPKKGSQHGISQLVRELSRERDFWFKWAFVESEEEMKKELIYIQSKSSFEYNFKRTLK